MPESLNNDEIRDILLRFLYDRHKNARGMSSISIGIQDFQSELKNHNIKKQAINSNLDYLVQKGWVCESIKKSQFTTKTGFQKTNDKVTYKISALGIDKLEGASLYSDNVRSSQINITNINGVTIVGDGNVVNKEMIELSTLLSELKRSVLMTTTLESSEKLSVTSDIGSIQSQLSKQKPLTNVIQSIWSGIEKIVIMADFSNLIAKIGVLISSLS